jgi:hypothetical protein
MFKCDNVKYFWRDVLNDIYGIVMFTLYLYAIIFSNVYYYQQQNTWLHSM